MSSWSMPVDAAGAGIFVGRAREIGELDGVRRRASGGRGELVLVAGEAGVGKTSLLEQVAARWASEGFGLAWATCWEEGTAPAFWPWAQLLQALTAGGSTITTSGASSRTFRSEGLERFAMFESVTADLRTAAARRPQLLVIDDLHAADAASLELLSFVGPGLRSAPIVVIAAYRTERVDADHELGRRLPNLLRWGRQVVLPGLSPDEIAELVAARTGSSPSQTAVSAIADRTRGNPFFVSELLRAADTPDSVERIASSGAKTAVPSSVRALLHDRIGDLSVHCRRMLEAASIVGPAVRVEVLAEALGEEVGAVAERIGEAIAAHILEAADVNSYRFTHGLLRDALYEELGAPQRAGLHHRAGEVLERLRERGHPVDAASLARHYFHAAAVMGEWQRAATFGHEAGDHAFASLAYEDAVRHYEDVLVCLDHLPEEHRRRGEVLIALADATMALGEQGRARTAALEAMAIGRASGAGELLARGALCLTSDPAGFEVALFDREQLAALEEASTALAHDTSSLHALVLARRSVALSLLLPPEQRREMADEALRLARDAADEGAVAYAMAARCDTIAGPDDVEERLVAAGEIITVAARRRDLRLQLLGHRLQLVAQLETGDVLAAGATVASFATLAAQLGRPLYEWLVPLWRGMQSLLRGETDDCNRWLEEASALGGRAASTNAALMCAVQRWFLLSETGRSSEALAVVRDAVGSMPEPGTVQRVALALALGEADQPEDARALLDATAPDALAAIPRDSEWLPMMGELARAIAAMGGHPLAAWAYPQLLPYRRLFMVEGIGAVLLGSVEHHLGLLANALGMAAEARDHFHAALAAHRRISASLLVARTLRDGKPLLDDQKLSPPAAGANVFRLDGDYWTVAHAGRVARIRDLKGIHDIARLLCQPGTEVHVLDLATPAGPRRATTPEMRHTEGGGDEVLDQRARNAYRSRIVELETEIEEADAFGDAERAAHARSERDALVDQLSSAYGLGGRARRTTSTGERARSTVTRRIHDALRRIDQTHPELAGHLRRAIKTGTFCVYEPDRPIRWET